MHYIAIWYSITWFLKLLIIIQFMKQPKYSSGLDLVFNDPYWRLFWGDTLQWRHDFPGTHHSLITEPLICHPIPVYCIVRYLKLQCFYSSWKFFTEILWEILWYLIKTWNNINISYEETGIDRRGPRLGMGFCSFNC